MLTTLLALYLGGVAVGIFVVDDRPAMRVLLAVLWPLGPAAFVIVATGLTLVAVVLWPWLMLPVLAALGGLVYGVLGALR
jgi:hypothetical protein